MTEATSKILQELLAKTKAGQINWELGSSEDVFILRLSSGTIRLSKREDEYEPTEYSASVLNKSGYQVDWVSDQEPLGPDTKVLKEIWEQAYENFFKVNETLRNMLGELKNPKGLLDF